MQTIESELDEVKAARHKANHNPNLNLNLNPNRSELDKVKAVRYKVDLKWEGHPDSVPNRITNQVDLELEATKSMLMTQQLAAR